METTVSVIVVNYNGMDYIDPFVSSLRDLDHDGYQVELIVVDNLSSDGSAQYIRSRYPDITLLENDMNNYARALNLGIRNAEGEFIATVNNDTILGKGWLTALMHVMLRGETIGAVQSKILFSDSQKINSLGVAEVEDFYFRDIGFGEEDSPDSPNGAGHEIDFFSGCSVLFRRKCLEQTGLFDENFVMYMEDIDYSIRCRDAGWRIALSPESIVLHKYHGAASSDLCEYFCSRNRLLLLAKRYPERLPVSVKTSHFFKNADFKSLYHALVQAVLILHRHHKLERVKPVLTDLTTELFEIFGAEKTGAFLRQIEVALGLRKIRVGIYDHAFHFAGGGQKYAAQIAEKFQDIFDITYIVNKPCDFSNYRDWFDIDLSRCHQKVIPLPFFERLNRFFIDEGMVIHEEENPFDIISEESSRYDIFINANMLTKVDPRSPVSVFICHFPDREREKFFHVDSYDYIITNSVYPTYWLFWKWGLKSSYILYPAVDMACGDCRISDKERIILSVARFEPGGSKKQLELIRTFKDLCREEPSHLDGWTLVVAGGTVDDNPYFEEVSREVSSTAGSILLLPNLPHSELKALYRRASLFWHACGLGETTPHLIEHFGMTTVEAMQNFCVPIVIDAGGQQEIVDHGINGFRFTTLDELKGFTLKIMKDTFLWEEMARNAYEKSKSYSPQVFDDKIRSIMGDLENMLMGGESLEIETTEYSSVSGIVKKE
jgi:GT2 family glycosyltransferase